MKFSEFPYYRADIDEFGIKFKQLLKNFKESKTFEIQNEVFLEIKDLFSEYDSMTGICLINYSLDINNIKYSEDKVYYDNAAPLIYGYGRELSIALTESAFVKMYEEKYSPKLIKNAILETKLFSDNISEDLVAESALSGEYFKIMANATPEFEGKEVTLSELKKHFISADREVRKKASAVFWKFFEDRKEMFDELFDKLVKVRNGTALKLGFGNFVELGYSRMNKDFTEKEAAVLRNNIVKYFVPLVLKLKERQKKRTGLGELMYYDNMLKFKNGNPVPKGNPEWIMKRAVKMYSELSRETKEFILYMTQNELMDLYSRKGKAGGGYAAYIHKFKSPFIFANMNGTSGDIDVLTHEAGHTFNSFLCRDFRIIDDYGSTSDICEIHSMSMEFLTYDHMNLFFKEDTEKFLFAHLEKSLSVLPSLAIGDEFQAKVYLNPAMSPDERNNLWRELEQKFIPGLRYDDNEYLESGCAWHSRDLFFNMPFYALEYVIAQICAYQFLFRMKINHSKTLKEYIELCKMGGKYELHELLKISGLDNPFEEKTIKETSEKVMILLDEFNDMKF